MWKLSPWYKQFISFIKIGGLEKSKSDKKNKWKG